MTYSPAPDLLNNRVILVTGAGQGLGRAAARAYAGLGATVVLHGLTVSKLEKVYDEIVAAGGCVGFVSSAELGQDPRVVPIRIEGPDMIMDEALICLRERSGGKLVRTFLEIASSLSGQELPSKAFG